MKSVHVVLPNDIDDPLAPSGGNVYDRRICQALGAAGWSVREHAVRGGWPRPSVSERAELTGVLRALPDDAVVLMDGLVASAVPDVLVPQARRLRLVVLVHMLVGEADESLRSQERQALSAAVAVVTTSFWSRQRLLDLYGLPADRVHVATPGVDAAPPAPGTPTGSNLLCVAAVAPHKGHDLLVLALAAIVDLSWSCVCVGSLDRDPAFVERLRKQAQASGIADRISFAGPRTGKDLDASYAAADLLVLASRGETYGMVVTEALSHAIPVLATEASGLPEALGRAPDGSLPGILVPPDDTMALAGALRRWLGQSELRHRLRQAAGSRRTTLTSWELTAKQVSTALSATTNSGAVR